MAANPDPLERDIERKVCEYSRKLGMLCYKFTSPSRRSVPDRMFITSSGVVFFIEFKRKGCKPTAGQEVEIAKIRATGIAVHVVDNVDDGKAFVSIAAACGLLSPKSPFVYDAYVHDLDKY